MATQRFMRKGITKVWLVPTIASATLVPTTAEVNAGTDLTPEVATITGFSYANQPIQTPDLASAFVSQISGQDATEDSSIEYYQRKGTDAIRTAQPKAYNGYVVIFYDGYAGASPAAGDKVDVWPVTIGSRSKLYTADNEAAKYRINFILTAPPGEDKALT